MNKLLKLTILTLAFWISASAGYSQADSLPMHELSLKQLLDIKITTAGKISQSTDLASAVVKVVTREQIRARGYQSLLDLLYDLPGFKIDDKIYSTMRNSVTVRGIQGNEKMLILLDGVSINSPSGEALPIMQNYPVHFAEQVEVLYGPASALYGANAVSGIINIITRKDNTKKLVADASSTVGMYGYTNSTMYLSKKLDDKSRISVGGQYYYDRQPDYSRIYADDPAFSMDSHRDGIFNTMYGQMSASTPVIPKYEAPMEAYNVYGNFTSGNFSGNLYHAFFKIPNSWENNTSHAVFNKDVYMAQTVTMASMTYKKQLGKVTSTSIFNASKYTLLPGSNYRNQFTFMEPGYKYSTSSMIRGEEQLDYRVTDHFNITGGISYEDYHSIPQSGDLAEPVDRNANLSGTYLGTRTENRPGGLPAQFYQIQYQNTGAYVQTQFQTFRNVNITAGARYDYNSRYGSTFNPRMGVVLKPTESTTIKALFGQAYRAPTPTDSYSHYGSFDSHDGGATYHSHFFHLPNPSLKPIRSDNTELHITQRVTDELILSFGAYYTTLKGLYASADDNYTAQLYHNVFNDIPVDYVEVFVNRSRQQNHGAELEVNWKHWIGPLNLRSYASVSYTNGIIKGGMNEYHEMSKDIEADFIAPWMVRIGTDMKLGRFTCSPRLLVMDKQRISGVRDDAGDLVRRQTIAGYQLLNVSMRYQVSEQFSVFMNGTNVLDQRYRNVSFLMDLKKEPTELHHGQPQDPIRIMGGLQWSL